MSRRSSHWTAKGSKGVLLLATALALVTAAGVESVFHSSTSAAQIAAPERSARGVAIVSHGGYPELYVDGKPFFIHSAAFHYYRVPRDQWERALGRYRELGINTIDLYIPWNWHEPREGEFDFDGHTNPRRDLRELLRLLTEKGFKLNARPGPQILNEWRHGGYPGWLLERPEYHMELVDRLDGRYPPFSYLNAHHTEAMAKDLLENATHMKYTRKWLEAVAHELAPYSSNRTVRVKPDSEGARETKEVSGPLLFVQLEDDMAIERTNYAGPIFWRYMQALRQMLEDGGLDVQAYINPTDMRVSAAGFGLERPIGAMGQWYMSPRGKGETDERLLNADDAATIEFFVEELKTQPAFVPILIEFQAGWYCLGNDDRPVSSPPSNTLLSSRLAFAHGLHGINYFPLQDTVTPAGYSVPWANRFYRWEAALDPNGNPQPRAIAVRRNAQMLTKWGEWLAASHKRADFGIVYPVGAYPQEQLTGPDVLQVSRMVQGLESTGQMVNLSSEFLDPEYQPVEQFLRHAAVLLPVADPTQPKFQLSEKAQQTLVEYVRRGGTLVNFPARPAGTIIGQLWSASPSSTPSPGTTLASFWRFGEGRVIEPAKGFGPPPSSTKEAEEETPDEEPGWAQQLLEVVRAAGVSPAVKLAPNQEKSHDLIVTELVSNEGTGLLGERTGGQGLLSVTNIGSEEAAEQPVEILSPRTSAPGAVGKYISIKLTVPSRESLLLPIEQPLCSAEPAATECDDAIVAAGAELLHAEREGKTLELTFYAPARSEVRLHLESQPSHVLLADELAAEAHWDTGTHELTIELPRGAAPEYRRSLNVSLHYAPHVPEKPRDQNHGRAGFDFSVTDAVRLPLGDGASLASDPPLVAIAVETGGELRVEATRFNEENSHDVSVKLQGPLRGSTGIRLFGKGTAPGRLKIKTPAGFQSLNGIEPSPDGFIHATLEVNSGDDHRSLPILFLPVKEGAVNHYQFDFDRDGANEWVLENTHLRLIVSPESGGQALGLVDKEARLDLLTSIGGLSDHFLYAENPPGVSPERARGRYGMFNRPYHAEWVDEQANPALRMRYEAPDIVPSGATIEKTARLEGNDTVRVDYRVQLHSAPGGADAAAKLEEHPQAFIAVNSVPVVFRKDRSTQFCWTLSGSDAQVAEGMHCESFSPGHARLELPEGVSRIEVRTWGRPGLALEWDCAKSCGRMTVEMKNFSALLELQFPALLPGGVVGEYSVRYRILSSERSGAE